VKQWLTFLRNHREAIAAMDFFTIPTLTFGVLCCFFVIGHDRRKILHFNVTRNPNTLWIIQQLREAWAYKQPHRFLLFDRDAKFGAEVVSAVREMGSEPTRTAFGCPWQNGVAERWVGSLSSYLLYYREDRTHLGLAKDTPAGRPIEIRTERESKIQSFPRLGGGCIIVMRWQRRLESYFSEDQTLFLGTWTRNRSRSLRASFAGRRTSLPSKTQELTSSGNKSF
jgi:hypothetical protein